METTRLEDLPAFQVHRVETSDTPRLFGVFTHLRSVVRGGSWLYDAGDPLIGDVIDLDPETRHAVFEAPFWTSKSRIQAGTSAPWLHYYYQAWHITILLDPAADWRRERFEPADRQCYVDRQGRRFSTKAGGPVEGAHPEELIAGGWDREDCTLCMHPIGARGGDDYGYRARGDAWAAYDCWLCDECGERYAIPRSLAFVWR